MTGERICFVRRRRQHNYRKKTETIIDLETETAAKRA